ncbi:MAG: gamma-carboxymuconolactone decarboxylase [Streptosporangiales bacterium]|nr:gamma-carboxymuconolactone decarboxylase [Streptosporangiales bacterium]
MEPGGRAHELREAFVEIHGHWDESWEGLLELDPDFFQSYLDLAAVPHRQGTLEPKVRQLILIAVDGAATHLYAPGLREHISRALDLGAAPEEIMEVLQLTATLGIHACNLGVPILLEEAAAMAGAAAEPEPFSARQEEIKSEFTEKRGYWNPFWDDLLRLAPEFFAAYTRFSSIPWGNGVLEPKVKELIYTAFDASATHMFEPGLRQHIRNALGYGATTSEIMEVLELTSLIGIHSCATGVPLLREILRRRRAGGAP